MVSPTWWCDAGDHVYDCAMKRDGSEFAFAAADGSVHVAPVRSSGVCPSSTTFQVSATAEALACAWSPDDSLLIGASADGLVGAWRLPPEKKSLTLDDATAIWEIGGAQVTSAVFAGPNGQPKLLITADSTVFQLALDARDPVPWLDFLDAGLRKGRDRDTDDAFCVCPLGDSSFAVVGWGNGSLSLCCTERAGDAAVHSWEAHEGPVTHVAAHAADETRIASCGLDGAVRVWNTRSTEAPLCSFAGSASPLFGCLWLSYSPEVLATCAHDGTLTLASSDTRVEPTRHRVYDAVWHSMAARFDGHGFVTAGCATPLSGQRAAGERSWTVVAWELGSQGEVRVARRENLAAGPDYRRLTGEGIEWHDQGSAFDLD